MLWRSRRWRKLLNLIDHLPRTTNYAQAVASDPEHARLLAAASGGKGDVEWHPPMSSWSTEAELLASVLDAVQALRHTTILANTSKGSKTPLAPTPYPRPVSEVAKIMSRAKHEDRRQRHEALADRLLSRRHDSSQK